MAITTLSQVNTILGLSEKDALITALIPIVEDDYLAIRNKPFDIGEVLTITHAADLGGNIGITLASHTYEIPVIIDDAISLIARKIYDALRYYFSLTYYNDTVTLFDLPSPVVFSGGVTGVTADASGSAIIYPAGAEMAAIQMIAYRINTQQSAGVASESLGDHSISYNADGSGYPKEIVGAIKRYVEFV